MNVPFCMGVGGSFDVMAGKVSRAPKWMQRFGLEWLHRVQQDPDAWWGDMREIFLSLPILSQRGESWDLKFRRRKG